MPSGVYKKTPEHRAKIAQTLREKRKGKAPKNFLAFQAKGHDAKRNSTWRKKSVAGYWGVHQWIQQQRGTPSICEECGTTESKRFEWHNKSERYLYRLDDWERLCVSCHRKKEYQLGGYVPWNKGKKVHSNTGRTHIKPGQHISPATEFKKGQKPHNAHLTQRNCAHCQNPFQPLDASRRFCGYPCYWDSMRKQKHIRPVGKET